MTSFSLSKAVHALRHAAGGADPLTPADIGAATPADIAALSATFVSSDDGVEFTWNGVAVSLGGGGAALPVVGQDDSALPEVWDLCISPASTLTTEAMGTLKVLGTPSNAFEKEWDGVDPVVGEDGAITCTTGPPSGAPGATALVNGSGVPTTSGATWTGATNAVGAQNAVNAVFTTATAYAVGYIDIPVTVPAVPAGNQVTSVVVHVQAFASSDGRMSYTAQPMDGATLLSTAQYANNTTNLTFTGVTVANLAAFKLRVQATHNEDTTSGTVSIDCVTVIVNYAPTPHYRSEVIFTGPASEGPYTAMRFVEGQRVRVAFDVLTKGLDAQDSGATSVIFQGIGASTNDSWPSPPLSLYVENKTWRVGGGTSIAYGELGNFATRPLHEDDRWTRWEFDILLGRGGVGTLTAWMDGVNIGTWTPSSGTYYGGTGNPAIDLAYIYFKCGLYGQATSMPLTPMALFRNRRFTVTSVDGLTTTTWRGAPPASPGLHIFRLNPATGMPFWEQGGPVSPSGMSDAALAAALGTGEAKAHLDTEYAPIGSGGGSALAAVPGVPNPADYGLAGWSMDIIDSTGALPATAGIIRGARVQSIPGATLLNVCSYASTQGAGLVNTFFGVYDSTGARLGVSADVSATMQTTGNKIIPMTAPFVVPADGVIVAVMLSGTATTPFQIGGTTAGSPALSFGFPGAGRNARSFTTGSGLSALPTTLDLSTVTAQAGVAWLAVSA